MPRMTGHEYFARAMRAYGVSHIFFVPTILSPAMALMEQNGVKQVITHGEKAAAYMADGYARASHRPGVCLCQDIGSTNLAAGLRDARMGSSPVIAISGGQDDMPRYRNAYQNAEDHNAWDGVTKANFVVETVDRLPDLLRQSFRVATGGSPGPVHLELRGATGQMLDGEVDTEVIVEERFLEYPAFRLEADAASISAAADLLAQAAKPIIVAGGGVVASGAGPEVVKLAERLSIPVATALNAKEIIPDDHPLAVGTPGSYSRECANRAVADADLVFFIGSHTGGQVTHGWRIPKIGTATIQLDINPEELGRNYPNAVSLQGDARVTLQRLLDAAEAQPPRKEWLQTVQGYVADFWKQNEEHLNSNAVPVRPERICKELTEWLPANSMLVADTFRAAIWTATMVKMNQPGQRYLRCAGSLGWGFPATLGARAALPADVPVIGFAGDAGFYYHIGELETAARNKLNAVMVVNNNYSGGVSSPSPFAREADLSKVAQALGCFGIRVEKPEEIRPALEKALASGRPAVVEVISDVRARHQNGWLPSES